MLESLFPFIHSGATLVPAKLIVPPGVSDSAQRRADLREMTISQRVAAAVALRTLGYKVVAKPAASSSTPSRSAATRSASSHPTDVIDLGQRHEDADDRDAARDPRPVKPGSTVALAITRGADHKTVSIKTVADPLERTARSSASRRPSPPTSACR